MRFYWMILALLLCTVGFSQIITVKDVNTKSSIDYVYIFNTAGGVYTDDKGRAAITDLADSEDSVLNFQHVGYQTYQISLEDLKAIDYSVLLTQSVISVDEITVTVNKWEQSIKDVPTFVKLVVKEQVTFENPQTSADLLGASQNVFIQKSQLGGGSPMIRGFSTSRVLLVVDGVRMNTAIFREGNVQNVISLDPNAVQNTEVLFGPGAAIYGSDALGGVMSFNTLAPNFSIGQPGLTSLNSFIRYSSANNELTGHMDFNFGYEKWAFTTSVSFSEFDNLKMGSNGPDEYLRTEYQTTMRGVDSVIQNPNPKEQLESGYSQLNLMQKIVFKPNRYVRMDLGLHFSTTSDVPRYDRLIRYRNDKLRYAEWYYGPQVWTMANLSMKYLKPSKMFTRFKWNIAYQFFKESRNSRSFNDLYLNTRRETVDAFSVNIDFDKRLSSNTDVFYGVEGLLNSVGSTAMDKNIVNFEEVAAGTRYPDGSKWSSAAAYATVKHKIDTRFILDGGLRYSYVSSSSTLDKSYYPLPFTEINNQSDALTGMVGFSYILSSSSRFYTHLSTGFRAPNIDDMAKVFDPEPYTVIVPRPDLNSEYLYSTEIGWVQKFATKYSFEVSAFYSYLANAMVRRPTTFYGQDSVYYDGDYSQVVALQNADHATIYGMQMGVFGDINKHFQAKANINYTYGEASDGQGLRHVSPLFGQVGVIFKHGWFRADLNVIYNGEISSDRMAPSEQSKSYLYLTDDKGKTYSPSWATLNLKMSFKLNHYLQILGGVENIMDERYRPYSSGIVAAGRNFYLTFRAYL